MVAVTADDLEYVVEALLSAVETTPLSGVWPAGVHGFHCELIVQCADFAIAAIESRPS